MMKETAAKKLINKEAQHALKQGRKKIKSILDNLNGKHDIQCRLRTPNGESGLPALLVFSRLSHKTNESANNDENNSHFKFQYIYL